MVSTMIPKIATKTVERKVTQVYTIHVICLDTGNEWFRTYNDSAAVINYINEIRALLGRTIAIEVF